MKAATSLKALAESKTEGFQKATYFKVRPDVVAFEQGFNLREEGEDLTEHINRLYLAMKAGAYIPPIDVAVVDGRVLVRDGHCRTRAALRLLDEGVEYLLEARQLRGNESDAVFHMLGSDQGKHFTPLEQGRGFLRLINMGHAVAEIAARTGMHRSTVENGLALAEAPVAVQQMVAAGKVASHTALKTVRQEGAAKATEKLAAGIEAAEKAGKKKATAKHIDGPKERGQTVPPAADKTFEAKCVEFVRTVADRSTLVTYQTRDMVELIEAAFDIVEPEGGGK